MASEPHGIYRMHRAGAPDVMAFEPAAPQAPGPGQVLIEHEAVGLNYIDTYHRSGLYPLPLPTRLGVEAAGRAIAIGDGVEGIVVGDAVAYAGGLGAYGTWNLMPANRLVKLPPSVSTEVAAASLLKGLTAAYLLERTYPATAETTMLVHAAAGGVGLILCQWARAIGATVIATVGSEAKADLALANGADHAILYRQEDVPARVRELTGGAGVQVSYDSVGAATCDMSLDSLAPLGLFVSYGNASGPITAISPQTLQDKGSLFFTRPTLATYAARTEDLRALAAAFFAQLDSGAVRIHINQRYPLSDLVQAHLDLEARKTTGSTVLIP
ncbi:MAG: quinone oxidoreductase [Pseudomonadota bacterium]